MGLKATSRVTNLMRAPSLIVTRYFVGGRDRIFLMMFCQTKQIRSEPDVESMI